MSAIDLRLGDWRQLLDGDEVFDAIITDPPYGAKTHAAYQGIGASALGNRNATFGYAHLAPGDVDEIVRLLAPRNTGWWAVQTSHDLAPHWIAAL